MALDLKLHHISSIPFAPITARKPQTLLNHPHFRARPIQQPNFSPLQVKSTRKNPNNRFRSSSSSSSSYLEVSNSNGGGSAGGGGGGAIGGEDPGKQGGGDEDGGADERFNLRWLFSPDRDYLGALAEPLRWVCSQVTWRLFSAMKECMVALSWSISATGQFIIIVATALLFCLCASLCFGLYFWL